MVYKLFYFDGRGVGEPARQLFALAGKEFEDVRYTDDTWPAHKAEMPFGQMPVLEVNGLKIAQSGAIFRYLAREFGFAGKTAVEQALVDSFYDLYRDYKKDVNNWIYLARGWEQGNAEEAYEKDFVPARDKFFGALEKQLKQNNTGFLVGKSVTYADIQIADHISHLLDFSAKDLDPYPEVRKLRETVEKIPQIAKWIKERPKSDF
ncbi:unnamed protein product, partial [Mesorhabditis belari]|uniref:glutathione transferase n=1 Tax=Mesorhabditis belari TaxID=2138241 RepID=A0AAF3FB42_9BILA